LEQMNPAQEQLDPPASRSPLAVEQLERLQARAGYRSGDERRPEDDPRVLREIAERQLLAERLDSRPPASPAQMTEALVALVGEPDYAARVEERAAAMERYYAQEDGDIWSRYERPDRRLHLSELVVRVEQGAAKCGLRIPRRPVVGTMPTYELNAQAISGPPGEGHLVVFDSGMFSYSTHLGQTVAQAIDAKWGEDGRSLLVDENTMFRVPGYFFALARQWADLLFSQAVLGTCVYVEIVRVSPQHAPFAEQLKQAIDTFALAHEYGHVILGHADLCDSKPDEAHGREFAADAVGFKICVASGGALWACLGASAFFLGSEAVELASNVFLTGASHCEPSPTHPSPAARRRAITQQSDSGNGNPNKVAHSIYETLGKLTGYVLPAFAEARRQGFPETGYRPADEYAKLAAFETFWRAGVALQMRQKS
jgi:hypothetical protein